MELKDYYLAELSAIRRRLDAYTEYGYTLELAPIVKALNTCYKTLKEEYQKINQ